MQTAKLSVGSCLATASATGALLGFGISVDKRGQKQLDGDADRSAILWIELGGQFDRLQDGQEQFSLPFFADIPKAGLTAPYAGTFPHGFHVAGILSLKNRRSYSIDEEGKISASSQMVRIGFFSRLHSL